MPSALERGAHELAGVVVAERRGQRGREPEARGAHGGDRAAAGRAHEIGGEALLSRSGQPFEADEREVEEGRRGDCEIDGHAASRIAVIRAPEGPAGRRRRARPWARSRARRWRRRAGRSRPRRGSRSARRAGPSPPRVSCAATSKPSMSGSCTSSSTRSGASAGRIAHAGGAVRRLAHDLEPLRLEQQIAPSRGSSGDRRRSARGQSSILIAPTRAGAR